jgi:hypothetical protein
MGDIAAKHDNQALQLGKTEDDAILDRSSTSGTSTPEGDHDRDAEPEHGAEVEAQGQPQQQKRKGGRKPVSKFPSSFAKYSHPQSFQWRIRPC